MPSVIEPAQRPRTRPEASGYELRVSAYDRVSSLVLALLVMVGVTVACLVIIWFTNRITHVPVAVPVELQDLGGGREDGVVGESIEIDAPDFSEIAAETDLVEPDVQQTLTMIADVALQQVELEDPQQAEDREARGGGRSVGDGRQAGFGSGEGGAGLSRAERWEIFFDEGGTLDNYARQLDFFGIELAAIGGGEVVYAFHLTKARPDTRRGASSLEQRLYMSWRRGALREADRALLQRAGIDVKGKVTVQFYPPEVENQLAQLEVAHANRQPHQIRKTRFGVQQSGGGFAFFVIDQTAL